MNVLFMHAVENMRLMDGYTGALSEQSIERLHSITNMEARYAINIKNDAKRTEYILEVINFYFNNNHKF